MLSLRRRVRIVFGLLGVGSNSGHVGSALVLSMLSLCLLLSWSFFVLLPTFATLVLLMFVPVLIAVGEVKQGCPCEITAGQPKRSTTQLSAYSRGFVHLISQRALK